MKSDHTRTPETELTGGLAVIYRNGYITVLLLMLVGILFPVVGWEFARYAYTAGIVLLMAIPVMTALWVGYRGIRNGDRRLVMVVAGIVLMLVLAGLISGL